ncbi:hypothetical protein Nepgr_009833 [Nepenthes gracilis]|uniref:Uncharacterized protein n=1 Tax=Nepenthes gracilis TaxID=150966 RepID=A0AAD3XKI3_NEPGR|nr:hypothetical protein Nepgr_009833 [Nepenthes gracilis]
MAKDEEKLLEGQLELQLQEQKESLSAIKEALVSDQNNIELLAVHDELVSSIRDAEEALLHLKRGRLLQQADSALQFFKPHVGDVEVESLDPTDFGVEPLEEQKFSVGSKCRFCYIDGRWYDGQVIELEGPYSAKVSFLTPTSERMLELTSPCRT